MCLRMIPVSLLLLISLQFLSCGSYTLQNGIQQQQLLEVQDISKIEIQKLERKLLIPSYVQEIIQQIPQNVNPIELWLAWFAGVQTPCAVQVVDWLFRLNESYTGDITTDNEKWVLQMIDAWGKIPEGILTGHVASHGDFDQCVETEAIIDKPALKIPLLPEPQNRFDGLYCTSYLIPSLKSGGGNNVDGTNMLGNFTSRHSVSLTDLLKLMTGATPTVFPFYPSIATCYPSTCSPSDVENMLRNAFRNLLVNYSLAVEPMLMDCRDRHVPSMDAGAISVVALIGTLVLLALIAGVVDYWQTHYTQNNEKITARPYQYLKAFSLYTNVQKLLGTRRSAGDLGCLHGIRFFSTAWVVLGHSYELFFQGPQWNWVDISDLYKKWSEMLIFNATFSVDTFFLMTGMLATYNILKMLEKTDGQLNIPMLYVHRYLRLTPTYAIIVGISATLLKYLGNGPMWWAYVYNEDYCQKNWWTNLLYINNIVHSSEMCLGESWYLANDMQFFLLTPFIVYPIFKWPTMGKLLLVIYTILSWISPVLVVRYLNAPPGPFLTRPDNSYNFNEMYIRPWSRISTFLAGVWLGYILHNTRGQRVKLPKFVVAFCWLGSTFVALVVIFAVFPWFDPMNTIPQAGGYLFVGLGRFAWALVVSWIIFACLKGYGGIVNEFLSWRVFMPLGRLCFCVYLTAFRLQGVFYGRLTVPIKWDSYTVVNLFFAHMVMSHFAAFICTVFFESPFMMLQRLLFEGVGEKKKPTVTARDKEEQPKQT